MNKEVIDLENLIRCEELISRKEKEIDDTKTKIKKMQEECDHPIKVCLGKQIITMGFARHESEYVECLICGKKLNLLNKKAEIDVSNEFIDIDSDTKRIILRRQLARTTYLNSELFKDENKEKTLVKK